MYLFVINCSQLYNTKNRNVNVYLTCLKKNNYNYGRLFDMFEEEKL